MTKLSGNQINQLQNFVFNKQMEAEQKNANQDRVNYSNLFYILEKIQTQPKPKEFEKKINKFIAEHKKNPPELKNQFMQNYGEAIKLMQEIRNELSRGRYNQFDNVVF